MTVSNLRLGAVARSARTTDQIEDLEFLLDNGEDPERAVARVGWSMATAQRTVARRGRRDLSVRLRQVAA